MDEENCREVFRQADMYFVLTGGNKFLNLQWPSELQFCEIGEYSIFPITSSSEVRQEKKAMEQFYGYVDWRFDFCDETCHVGLARLFSIRSISGRRVATVRLDWDEDYWKTARVIGVADNIEIETTTSFYDGETTRAIIEPTELYFVIQELIQRFRVAWSSKMLGLTLKILKAESE